MSDLVNIDPQKNDSYPLEQTVSRPESPTESISDIDFDKIDAKIALDRDYFDNVIDIEQSYSEIGFAKGKVDALKRTKAQGVALGFEYGHEMGEEIGFYVGFCFSMLDSFKQQYFACLSEQQSSPKTSSTEHSTITPETTPYNLDLSDPALTLDEIKDYNRSFFSVLVPDDVLLTSRQSNAADSSSTKPSSANTSTAKTPTTTSSTETSKDPKTTKSNSIDDDGEDSMIGNVIKKTKSAGTDANVSTSGDAASRSLTLEAKMSLKSLQQLLSFSPLKYTSIVTQLLNILFIAQSIRFMPGETGDVHLVTELRSKSKALFARLGVAPIFRDDSIIDF